MTQLSMVAEKGDRLPGAAQGILLLCGSCLPIMGAVLLGPVLPEIADHFAGVSHVGIITPMLMTAPALMVALSAPLMGILVDRSGRKQPLIVALAAYSVIGLAPIWLASIYGILVSRLLLGIAEALIMTACTTLIADYFSGKAREKWLSLQAGLAAFSATLFFAAGGLMGSMGWRTPFWLYAAGWVLVPLVLWLIWSPGAARRELADDEESGSSLQRPLVYFAYPMAIVAGIGLLLIPIQLGFLLRDIGIDSPKITGALSAANQSAVLLGALLFPLISRIGFQWLFVVSLLLVGGGVLGASTGIAIPVLLASSCVAGLGSGLLLTSLINWTFASLSSSSRGRGAGIFNSCLFLGEFLSPLVVAGVMKAGLTLNASVAICGIVLGMLAIAGFIFPSNQAKSLK